MFTPDELEDIWSVLETSFRSDNLKAITTCLETLLNPTHTSSNSWKTSNLELVNKILEQESSKSLHKILTLAQELKVSIEMFHNHNIVTLGDQSESKSESESTPGEMMSSSDSNFDKPVSLRVCMFHLGESSNLERISNVLQNLSSYSTDQLLKLTEKYDFHLKLIKVIQKYCNGDYGFDSLTSKRGLFQLYYSKVVAKTFSVPYLVSDLISSDFYDLYTQLIEEALIYAYDFSGSEVPQN